MEGFGKAEKVEETKFTFKRNGHPGQCASVVEHQPMNQKVMI